MRPIMCPACGSEVRAGSFCPAHGSLHGSAQLVPTLETPQVSPAAYWHRIRLYLETRAVWMLVIALATLFAGLRVAGVSGIAVGLALGFVGAIVAFTALVVHE
jgi:hypothetical protein